MIDVIELFGNSLIQHGRANDRIYVMKFDCRDMPSLVENLHELAVNNRYSKIFAKIPVDHAPLFLNDGYRVEGYIPNYYNGSRDLFFLGKYYDDTRLQYNEASIHKLYDLLMSPVRIPCPDKTINIEALSENDIEEMAGLYSTVFKSYPFPIHDPSYLLETMRDNVYYYGIRHEGRLIALSSSETDTKSMTSEMTDFAVLPEFRGKSLSFHLLIAMEPEMIKKGFTCFYTIARLDEPGMNKTFQKAGYKYSGTLINNTQIAGKLENMNIWYKNV